MASLVRPSMLRRLVISALSVRTITARTLYAPLTTQSQKHRTPAIVSKVSFVQLNCLRSNSPAFTRVAAFHVTSRKSILPALPRECLHLPLVPRSLLNVLEHVEGTGTSKLQSVNNFVKLTT